MPGGKNPPPSVVASWPKPNYVNPATQGSADIVGSIFLGFFTLFVVAARLWARVIIVRQPGIDDYLIAVSAILSIGVLVVVWVKEYHEANRHVYDIHPSQKVLLNFTTWLGTLFVFSAMALTKCSILFFYKRVMSRTTGKVFHWMVNSLIIFVVLYTIGWTLAQIFACSPIDAFWKRYQRNPAYTKKFHCWNEAYFYPYNSVMNVATDFIIALLPMFFLRRLRLPRKQLWALMAIFSLGLFVCAAGVVRTSILFGIYYHTYDTTWLAHPAWGWTTTETDLGIICACAPALKPFFSRYLGGNAENLSRPSEVRPIALSARKTQELHTGGLSHHSSHGSEQDVESQKFASTSTQGGSDIPEHSVRKETTVQVSYSYS